MHPAIAQVVRRQETLHRLLGRQLHHVLGMGQERAVHRERHRHAHAVVLRDAVADEDMFERLLCRGRPAEQPSHVAHGQGVVVLDAKRSGVVERPVADEEQRRQAIGGRDDKRLEPVHPPGPAAAREGACADRAGVLDDFELRVLGIGNDVLGVELAVRDDLRQRVHHLGVGTDRVRRDDVDVGQLDALRHCLTSVEQQLLGPNLRLFEYCGHGS